MLHYFDLREMDEAEARKPTILGGIGCHRKIPEI